MQFLQATHGINTKFVLSIKQVVIFESIIKLLIPLFLLQFLSIWSSCVWSEFSFYRSFNRTQHTKKFTVPFTRIGIDNKSVSVCVPAIVYACAHMPVCVCVCLCVRV